VRILDVSQTGETIPYPPFCDRVRAGGSRVVPDAAHMTAILNEAGLWMVAPIEEQAYQLDARYTKDPADVFSVADEIQEWLRAGKY
jgi:hypothetical protein